MMKLQYKILMSALVLNLGCTDGNLIGNSGSGSGNCVPSLVKRVFLTSTTYNGNLGGISGADAICQAVANSANLCGTFRAWISTSINNAITRIVDRSPWYLVDKTTVVFSAYPSGVVLPLVPITFENGNPPTGTVAWTATSTSGIYSTADCVAWTDGTGGPTGLKGLPGATSGGWTQNGSAACNGLGRLICFEQ